MIFHVHVRRVRLLELLFHGFFFVPFFVCEFVYLFFLRLQSVPRKQQLSRVATHEDRPVTVWK